MKNICKLLSSGIFVVLRINYTGENISTIDSVITNVFSVTTESMRAFLSVSLQQVWQTKAMDLSNEVDQVIESINKHKIKVLKTAFDCVKNPCYADLRYSAVVNFNGDVYKCTAVDFFNVKRDGFLSPEGTIIWENNSNEKRLASRFKRNYACDVCRIRPLCFGGCSQKALNTNNDSSCPYNFNEEQKDRIVLNRFSLFLERKK